MATGDGTTHSYAPKSPDLSSFYAQPHPTSQPPNRLQQHVGPEPQYHLQQAPLQNYKQHAYLPHDSAYSQPYPPAPQPALEAQTTFPQTYGAPVKPEYSQDLSPHAAPSYPPQTAPHQAPSLDAYGVPLSAHPQDARAPFAQQLPPSNAYFGGASFLPSQEQGNLPPVKQEDLLDPQPSMQSREAPAPAPVLDPSPVKTKFPTARIKRIMQADEEVGKVAQQTPIAVGKALEMFMVQLVSKSAEVAKEKGSKRVTATMLKQVVETDDQWDFLTDIVSRVEVEKEGSSKSKAKMESESEEEVEVKKKGRGGRRKKSEP